MSNRNSEHPGHPGSARPHAEPLDDIILEGDDDTGAARRAAVAAEAKGEAKREPSRAPPPSAQSEDVKKTQRQKLLRIPDDEVSRPSQLPQADSEPRVPLRHPASFDPESTVKMSALELDSSTELPPDPHDPHRVQAKQASARPQLDSDEDSWTPLQPIAEHDLPKADWAPQAQDNVDRVGRDARDGNRDRRAGRDQPHDRMREEMPTPPPTSEEIPVALEDPSSDSIPVAEPSSPIGLEKRASQPAPRETDGDLPPQRPRTQTAPLPPALAAASPPPARDSRDSLATQIDSAELGSIDVNFQSAPNFDAIDADSRGSIGGPKAPLEMRARAETTELAPDDVVAVDSSPHRVPAQHHPPPPPPMRAKTQSTPSIPPPPQPPPMRPKTASTPSVPPGTLAPQTPHASPQPGAAQPTGTTPAQGAAIAQAVGAAQTAHKPAKPPPPGAAAMPTAVSAGGVVTASSAPIANAPPGATLPSAAANASAAATTPTTPAAPTAPTTKPMLFMPPATEVALAPPPLHEARAQKRIRPWWEELFNDDFIRAMEKLTDPQIKREADFIEDSLGVAKGAMVLDLACGTGRHAIELSKRGYGVVGFDLSLAMLARAAEEADERNATLNFVQGDMREMTFEEMFDGIYSWSTSFGFFEEEKNANVIQRVHRALKKGGQFLLDVVNRDYVARQAPSLVWFEGDGCVCMDEMSIDWITSRMKIKRTMMIEDGRSREIEFSMRLYALHELGKLLHDAGFRVAEVSGRTATPGVFFGADSPRTIILAEKRV